MEAPITGMYNKKCFLLMFVLAGLEVVEAEEAQNTDVEMVVLRTGEG